MTKANLPLRLAFRTEGDNWNAYAAKIGTMQDAIWLGSIKMRFVTNKSERKEGFMSFMFECFADICEDCFGKRPEMYEVNEAPDHERAGNS